MKIQSVKILILVSTVCLLGLFISSKIERVPDGFTTLSAVEEYIDKLNLMYFNVRRAMEESNVNKLEVNTSLMDFFEKHAEDRFKSLISTAQLSYELHDGTGNYVLNMSEGQASNKSDELIFMKGSDYINEAMRSLKSNVSAVFSYVVLKSDDSTYYRFTALDNDLDRLEVIVKDVNLKFTLEIDSEGKITKSSLRQYDNNTLLSEEFYTVVAQTNYMFVKEVLVKKYLPDGNVRVFNNIVNYDYGNRTMPLKSIKVHASGFMPDMEVGRPNIKFPDLITVQFEPT